MLANKNFTFTNPVANPIIILLNTLIIFTFDSVQEPLMVYQLNKVTLNIVASYPVSFYTNGVYLSVHDIFVMKEQPIRLGIVAGMIDRFHISASAKCAALVCFKDDQRDVIIGFSLPITFTSILWQMPMNMKKYMLQQWLPVE